MDDDGEVRLPTVSHATIEPLPIVFQLRRWKPLHQGHVCTVVVVSSTSLTLSGGHPAHAANIPGTAFTTPSDCVPIASCSAEPGTLARIGPTV
jgi:hypothetical protein